jgi:hypothetical protein
MPRTLTLRPEVTCDHLGIRANYDDGSSTFLAWKDICKIELLSLKPRRTRRGRFFLFWGPDDKTVLIPYDQAPLAPVQEFQWLPGFTIDEALSPPSRIRGDSESRVTFWERPSLKHDRRSI